MVIFFLFCCNLTWVSVNWVFPQLNQTWIPKKGRGLKPVMLHLWLSGAIQSESPNLIAITSLSETLNSVLTLLFYLPWTLRCFKRNFQVAYTLTEITLGIVFTQALHNLFFVSQVLVNDFFLVACLEDFIENARLFIFETFCRIHQCISIRSVTWCNPNEITLTITSYESVSHHCHCKDTVKLPSDSCTTKSRQTSLKTNRK